jgi:SAP domain-containing ribonucleoprotein
MFYRNDLTNAFYFKFLELLQKFGIPHSGKKEELIERLVKNDERKALEKLERELEMDEELSDSKLEL